MGAAAGPREDVAPVIDDPFSDAHASFWARPSEPAARRAASFIPAAVPAPLGGFLTKPAKGDQTRKLQLHSQNQEPQTVKLDQASIEALARYLAPQLLAHLGVAAAVVQAHPAERFRLEMVEEYATAMRRRKPFPDRKEPYAESVVSDDKKHLRFLLAHAAPVDFDDESSWQRHKDYRVEREGKPPSVTEDYRKTLRRFQKWRGVAWPSLAEKETRPHKRRALPTREIAARVVSPSVKLGGYVYTDALRKSALVFVQGTGARPPSEVAAAELDDVKWTTREGFVFTLRAFHDAAFRGEAAEVERLWRLALEETTRSAVTVRQQKKRGRADELRVATHAPAWALAGKNARSLVSYVVHHRAKVARRVGGIESGRLFVKWNGQPFGGKNPMKGCFARLQRVVAAEVWSDYTNYSLRGFHAKEVHRATGDARAAAAAIGDTVAVTDRHYLGDPAESLEGVQLKQPRKAVRKGAL